MPSLAEQAQTIANLYQRPTVGRPSDIGSPTTVQQFLEAVGEGNYIETAAKLAGISKAVVYNWIKRGEAGEQPYDRFVDALQRAEARAEAAMVRNVRKASELPQFWAAAATHLERRHPDRWGKRQDDTNQPKVVVQIGVGTGDVRVGILSPANVNDLACANPSQVEMLSPISGDYVNQREDVPALTGAAIDAAELRQLPAVESGGGSHPGGAEAQQPVGGPLKQRRVGAAGRKKAQDGV